MGSLQQMLLGMAGSTFTPASLSPIAWLDPTGNATYSGSNLSTAANAGSAGGSFTITGTIAKVTSGSLSLLTMDNISKRLNLAFAIASGTMTIWWAGKLNATGAGAAGSPIMGYQWPASGTGITAKAYYVNSGLPGDNIFFGNDCCAVDAGHAPAFYSAAGGLSDSSFHTLVGTVGTTNALWRDGSAQTITGGSNASATGAMPSTGSISWDFGVGDVTTETANADIATIMITNSLPSAADVTNFHNYYNSRA